MSGIYFAEAEPDADKAKLAAILAGQIAEGDESLNHYATANDAVFGIVSQDHLKQGVFPRLDPATGLWIVLQGELYDSDARAKLRQEFVVEDDAALFAHAIKSGELIHHLPTLNGAFFVMAYDPETKTLTCANDRYGLYPMYWAHDGGRLCMADRVLCSVVAGIVDGAWDPEGLAMLLTIDDYVGETTLVKDVSVYPQATMLTYADNKLDWQRYWHYDFTPTLEADGIHAAADRIGNAFVDSVKRQSKTGRRIGVTLSGGLDSRLIVAATAKADVSAHTFTWGVDGCFDRQFAADVGRAFGTTHHDCEYNFAGFESEFEHAGRLAEGLINYFDAHMIAHLGIMKADADLILNGFAGDVTLGGSFLRPAWMNPQPADDTAKRIYEWRNTLLGADELSALMNESAKGPSRRFHELFEPLADLPTPDRVDRFILENRQRRLTAMGTVIMRAAVESTAPFFDYDMIDLQCAAPAAWRHEHRLYKQVMKIAFPKTLELRWQRTLMPAGYPEWMSTPAKAVLKACRISEKAVGWPRIASRQSPVALTQWLAGPLSSWMESVACEPHAVADEALKRDASANAWKKQKEHGGQERLLGAIASINSFGRALERARAKSPALVTSPTRVES